MTLSAIDRDAPLYEAWRRSGLNYKQYWQQHEANAMTYQAFRCRVWRVKNAVGYTPDVWRVDFGAPLTIDCDDAIIVGDVQLPTTDFDFAMLPAMVAKRHLRRGNRTLVIAGDLFNMDGFSKYEKVVPLPRIEQELEAASELLEAWLKVFDRVYVFMGNHERRLSKLTGAQLEFHRLMKSVTTSNRVTTSHWGWMELKSSTGTWRVTHGTNYSVNQLTVADTLAQKHGCHVISHHEHHLAQGWDRYKRNIVINNGGLFDQQKMSYVILDDSKMPVMAQGFTMLKGGFPTVFGQSPYTNWQEWL